MSEIKPDSITKKLIKIFKNYGLNINSMSDEEFMRMSDLYEKNNSIDEDLRNSEEASDEYSEDII